MGKGLSLRKKGSRFPEHQQERRAGITEEREARQ